MAGSAIVLEHGLFVDDTWIKEVILCVLADIIKV